MILNLNIEKNMKHIINRINWTKFALILTLMWFAPAGMNAQDSWSSLNSQLAVDETEITLPDDVVAASGDVALVVPNGVSVVIDLNGHNLNRNLTAAVANGYVIKVSNGGTLTVKDTSDGEGGIITGGYNFGNGGGIYNEGTLIIQSGSVSGNITTGSGGGIYSTASATLNIIGGTITQNKSNTKGGGIHLAGGDNNSISNAAITQNRVELNANGYGGGVYIEKGTLTVTNTSFSANYSNNQGGGIFVNNGVVTLVGSIVNANMAFAKSAGGGIFHKAGTLTVDGGEIKQNIGFKDKTNVGCGIYVDTNATLKLKGAVKVSDNSYGLLSNGTVSEYGKISNVFIRPNKLVTIDGPLDDGNGTKAEVGITLESKSNNKVFTSGLSGNGDHTNFTDDENNYLIGLDENGEAKFTTDITVKFRNPEDPSATMDDFTFSKTASSAQLPECTFTAPDNQIFGYWTTETDGTGTRFEDKGVITPLASIITLYAQWISFDVYNGWSILRNRLLEDEDDVINITLENDVVAHDDDLMLVVPNGKTVTIDLNGHNLNRNLSAAKSDGCVIHVEQGASLTFLDTPGGGKITGGFNSGNGGGIWNEGTLVMQGGEVSGNTTTGAGGGIYSSGGATLTLTSTDVINNTANIKGGGIYVDDGNNTITSCNINSNKTKLNNDGQGGGIYLNSGSLTATQTTIANNSGNNAGGGIYIGSGNATMVNCNVTDNSAYANACGGGVYLNGGTLTIDGGAVTGNIGTKTRASSNGYGVYAAANTTFNMRGAVRIEDNHHKDGPAYINNVYVLQNYFIHITGALSDGENTADVGVTMQINGVFTTGLKGNGDEDCFSSDNTDYVVGLDAKGDAVIGTTLTVSFRNPEDASATMDDFVFIDGISVPLPECTFTPPAGKIFAYWNTEADGTGTRYDDQAVTAGITENTTLYAQWTDFTGYVARIGEREFTTLQKAANAAANAATDAEKTVVLLMSCEQSATVSNDMILDLAGQTLTGTLAIVSGELAVTDNSKEQTGKIANSEDAVYAIEVNNGGTLTVEGGTIASPNDYTIMAYAGATVNIQGGAVQNSGRYALYNSGEVFISGGTVSAGSFTLHNFGELTITGATISADTNYAIYHSGTKMDMTGGTVRVGDSGAIVTSSSYAVNISGGVIESTSTENGYAISNYTANGIINISGNTFVKAPIPLRTNDNKKFHVFVYGGTFKASQTLLNAYLFTKVYGGMFNLRENKLLCAVADDDYTITADKTVTGYDGDSYYTLCRREMMCKIGETEYYSILSAIKAIEASGSSEPVTITMQRNVTDGPGIAIPDVMRNKNMDITIDFNGYSYAVQGVSVGSDQTISQAMHFIYGNKLTMKNGTVSVVQNSPSILMLMQNYCDLTLEDMVIDGTNVATPATGDTPSFNFIYGKSCIKGATHIILPPAYGEMTVSGTLNMGKDSGNYTDGASLTIIGNEVKFTNGLFQIRGTSGIYGGLNINGGWFDKFNILETVDDDLIEISGGTSDIDIEALGKERNKNYLADGYVSIDNQDDTWTVRYPLYEADGGYTRTEDFPVTSVYYTRTFNKSVGQYQCWFVPFDYEITEADAANCTFYDMKQVGQQDGDTYLYIEEMSVGDVLEHNTPYVVKCAAKETHGFASQYDACLYAKDETAKLTELDTGYAFYGTYAQTYATQDNEWFTISIDGTSFWSRPGDDVKAFRWVLKDNGGGNSRGRMVITENLNDLMNDDPTSIANTTGGDGMDIEAVYAIDGVKTDELRNGLNIVRMKDGSVKKIFVK